MLHGFNALFPIWAILFSSIAYFFPDQFIVLKPSIIYLLAFVMLSMGITLNINDFKKLLSLRSLIFVGLVLQFTIMPLSAWIISLGFGLSLPLLTGMLLVGTCPGGTASNVICYLANGNVALSLALTSCSTLLAIVATPLLTWLYLGESVEVPIFSMILTMLKVIVIPVAIGVLINHLLGKKLEGALNIFPSISILSICLIIAIIISLNQSRLQSIAFVVIAAVVLHNTIGLLAGYIFSILIGYNNKVARTMAIEVGMQNSGLAVALASQYFQPIVALPGAVFSIWHNLSGSILATIWSRSNN
ncbi:MAG: bile acid:sodium symporter family protein [Gammaproteobacteria bacterium]